MNATFSEVAASWIARKRKLVKPSTFHAYNLILVKHLMPLFSNSTAVSEDDAQQMVLDKLQSGLRRKTVRDILATLKDIVKYGAKYMGFPLEVWDIQFPSSSLGRAIPVMAVKDQRKLMSHIIDAPSTRNIGILISLSTGMRIGEVCGLQWADVSLRERLIHVRRTVGRVYDIENKKTIRIQSDPKTRSSYRTVPISRELTSALRTVRRSHPSALYVVGGGDLPTEPRTYRESYDRLLSKLGIPRIVYHGLRHTFATRCVENGCDYKAISAILGHSNVATTLNLYVHPDENQKRNVVDRISKVLKLDISTDPKEGGEK